MSNECCVHIDDETTLTPKCLEHLSCENKSCIGNAKRESFEDHFPFCVTKAVLSCSDSATCTMVVSILHVVDRDRFTPAALSTMSDPVGR